MSNRKEDKLELKNINIFSNFQDKVNISPRASNNLKIYCQSKKDDDYYREKHQPSFDIYETIKTYLGIELIGFYIDEEGKIYIREGNEQLSRIIEFESNDEIGNYIEYLINLSILKKLDNEQIEVRRAETGRKVNIVMKKRQLEMNTMAREKYGASWKEHVDEFREIEETATVQKNQIFNIKSSSEEEYTLTLEEISQKLKEKISIMSTGDIKKSGLSPFEIRKLISLQYGDVELSDEEIEAISLYKCGWYNDINQFLIGNIEIKDEDTFFKERLENLIRISGLIYAGQKKFKTDRDIILLRTDSVNENMDNGIKYENFVSTTIAPQTFDRRHGGRSKSIL